MEAAIIGAWWYIYFFFDVLWGGGARQGRVTQVTKAVRWRQGAVKVGGGNGFVDYKQGRECEELVCVISCGYVKIGLRVLECGGI